MAHNQRSSRLGIVLGPVSAAVVAGVLLFAKVPGGHEASAASVRGAACPPITVADIRAGMAVGVERGWRDPSHLDTFDRVFAGKDHWAWRDARGLPGAERVPVARPPAARRVRRAAGSTLN